MTAFEQFECSIMKQNPNS